MENNPGSDKKSAPFTLPGLTKAPQSASLPSPTRPSGRTGDALFKRPLKKKKVLFPKGLRRDTLTAPKDPTEIPVLHPTGYKEKKRLVDLIMGYKAGDAALLMSGLAVFIMAPLLAGMLVLASGDGTVFGQKGVSVVGSLFGDFFGEDLLGGLVARAFGRLLHKEAKPALPAVGRDPTLDGGAKPESGLLGDASAGGEIRSPWSEALRSAARGVGGATQGAGIAPGGAKLANKVSSLPSTFRDESGSGAKSSSLAAPSSKELTRTPSIDSNLSRMSVAQDFAGISHGGGATLRSQTVGTGGEGGTNFFGTRGQRGPTGLQEMRSVTAPPVVREGALASTPDPSGQTVDPVIQKLNDIHTKYEAKLESDKQAVAAAEKALNSAQSSIAMIAPMLSLGSALASLASNQAAYSNALSGWNKDVAGHWGNNNIAKGMGGKGNPNFDGARGGPHGGPHNGPHGGPHNGPHSGPHNGPHSGPHNGPHNGPNNGPRVNAHNSTEAGRINGGFRETSERGKRSRNKAQTKSDGLKAQNR